MSQCPFCKTEVNENASVCASCGATKGLMSWRGKMYGFPMTLFAFIFNGLIGLFFILADQWFAGLAILGIAFYFGRGLFTGPRWFR